MPDLAAFSITLARPASSDTSSSRSLPTSAGSMCSNVVASALHAGDVHAALVGERVAPDVGLVGIGREVEELVDEVRRLGEPRELLVGQAAKPSLSWRLAMIETRFALPVRSPQPFIVP